MSGARIEHKPAADLTPAWLGRRVTVQTIAGPVTGGLSDFDRAGETVLLYIGGRRIVVWPSTTVTHDGLGLLGGAA